MSKSGIRRKHDENATKIHKRSHSASHTYKKGLSGRANGGTMQDARVDKVQGPLVSLPEEDRAGGGQLGGG